MKERVAIVDLGTNTFHLLIAEKDGPLPHILHREKQPVKIGLAGINQGIITPAAADRALECLKQFRKTIDASKVHHVHAFGTSAIRSAANGSDILERIRMETGIKVNVISGDEEAIYIYNGVKLALELGPEKSLIMDIGGGSVEFIIGNDSEIFWKQSFDIGAQRMLERFQKNDPILPDEIRQLEKHFDSTLAPLREAMTRHTPKVLVGSSGTFDTLSEIYCINYSIDITAELPETPLAILDFYDIQRDLVSKNRNDRMTIPGMIEMRVDMIVVASCLIKYILDKYPLEEIRVSTYSLKEGVLATLLQG